MSEAAPDLIQIRPATEGDVEALYGLILELAEYERLGVRGDAETLRRSLFGQRRRRR